MPEAEAQPERALVGEHVTPQLITDSQDELDAVLVEVRVVLRSLFRRFAVGPIKEYYRFQG